MPIYEYQCPSCADISYQTVTKTMNPPSLECPEGHGPLQRRFSFATPKIDMGGYDPSLGRHFESSRERQEYLVRLSAETTERQGYETKLVSVHPADMPETSGVREEVEVGYHPTTKNERREEVRWL